MHLRFGPQHFEPEPVPQRICFGFAQGAWVVVGDGVVVVVPPVHAWSTPQEESFSQVWHSWPLLPQLALLVPPEQAPVEVQQPLKSVPPILQTLQIEPPVPQTKVPS